GLFVVTIAILCLEQESPVQMIGILGGYLYAGFRLMPGLNRIINQLNIFKSAIPSIERIHQEYTMIAAKENYVHVPAFEFTRGIEISDLSFQYLNTAKNALSNVSLTIKKGQCIGIVGETGSGKSTLVDIILGLLKPIEGSILVDGQYPVNAYEWHQKIGYVPQSIYLTDDTIEKNIAFGDNDIHEDRLNAAIDAAQLRKFINALPDGAKTIVGERGVRLSGGERQRIAIARALYRNPEVLIFDEATSALDHETEARLMETINAVSRDRTVIMIAHRITTLQNCDQIVVMENGTLKEITTYSKLKGE
ncbi:MAG: ABC transporter ATP-binding protein, partial [Alphaproteobacteria bacterium]|nr:ABC transporter ATP-binding protein [Alphaproteobacteria bacterium]